MGSGIYTRTGDRGTTSLVDGTRVPKDAIRIEAYGCVDEANAWIGSSRSSSNDEILDGILEFVQHRFYNCSSNLATPPGSSFEPVGISESDVEFLERSIDLLEKKTGKISGFVLPGGSLTAGWLHVARTVCRRAERVMWTLSSKESVDDKVLRFMNRSSDLLFAAARYAAKVEGDGDVLWDNQLPEPDSF